MRRIILPWAKRVEQATKGAVKVRMTGASMGGWSAGIDLVGQGIVDANFGTYGVIGGRFTLAKMTEIPLLGATDPRAVSLAFWRSYHKHFARALEHEKAGTIALAMWTSGANHFFTREKPITTAADLKGLKFMVPNETADRILRHFGAVGIVTPQEQIYDVVSKGIVDGAIVANTGPSATKTDRFYKFQTVVPGSLYFSGFYIVMNKRKYNSLSKADRAALDSVSGESLVSAAAAVFAELDRSELEKRKAAGRTKITVANAAFLKQIAEKTKFIEEQWLRAARKLGYPGEQALRDLRAQAAKLAKAQ